MNIGYISDMHCEYAGLDFLYKLNAQRNNIDALVIAGDLHTSSFLIDTLNKINDAYNKLILFVLGNHDYYGTAKMVMDIKLAQAFANHRNIHILNDSIYEHEDIVFIGSTGWWDTSYYLELRMPDNFHESLTDFAKIEDIRDYSDGVIWGLDSREFFVNQLALNQGKKIVCISHNAPTKQSIHPRFKDNPLNGCFANEWTYMIELYKPKAWIHGHVHDTMDYTIGDTRIVCNPRGYASYNRPGANLDFKLDKIITI